MRRIVAAVQAVGADTSAGVCRVDDLTIAHVNRYMTDTAAVVGEEYQIARLKAGLGNLLAAGILRSGRARDGFTEVLVHVLSKTRAVEGARAGCTVNIRATEEALSVRNNAGAGNTAAGARGRIRNTAAAGWLGRRQVAGADIAVTAAVLDLIPVTGGIDYADLLAIGKGALGSVRSTLAGADIQTGNRAVHRLGRGSGAGRTGIRIYCRRGCILAADVAIAAAVLDLIPAAGGANNRC